MAAYINELHIDPLFGTRAEDQYVELRGDPGTALAAGTYLVSIGSADGVTELGDVQSIFDLSGQQFGANGLMVLMQSAGGYSVDPAARLLRGTDGFRGIAGGIFTADGTAKEIRAGSSSYLLIQSATAPTLTTDIDLNDDGIPETAYPNWTILDGVSALIWVESVFPLKAYAPIVFRERAVGSAMPGATVVDTSQIAYVGRIASSTGYAPGDWLVGNTVELSSSPWQFQLQHGVFGTPLPIAYGGRILDHVGAPNWYGNVTGSVFRDDNADGIQQPGEPPVSGVSVVADLVSDLGSNVITDRIEPNDYATGVDVSSISANVTLISAGSDNIPQGFKIRPVQQFGAPNGEHIFSHENVGFFNNNRRLRMDFYRPARSVSIDVIGNSDLSATYGRLEIFNAAGQSLGFVRTGALGGNVKQRLTMSSGADNIAWALAYSDEAHLSSSPFGMLDNLTFQLGKVSVTSDASGVYRLAPLTRGNYSIRAIAPLTYDQVFPAANAAHVRTVNKYESHQGVNFGFEGNQPPKLADQEFQIDERQVQGANLASLPIQKGYRSQQARATITSGDARGLFRIDTLTNQLILEKAELDFESVNSYPLQVKLEDTNAPVLNSTATIRLTIRDSNEPPAVASQAVTTAEHSANGTQIGTMNAADPDAGAAGQFDWSIVSGNSAGALAIDASTGIVKVANSDALDFESSSKLTLRIRATDRGTPAQFGEGNFEVTLSDINEAPKVPPQKLSIAENSPAGTLAGQALVVDPDANQTFNWTITGGTGTDLFEIEPSTGKIRVKTGATFNFESANSYELNVTASDSGSPGLSGSGTISLSITDVNDPPTMAPQAFMISEAASGGSAVGVVVATDQDPGQTVSFLIVNGTDSANFSIDASTGQLRLSAAPSLDFETRPVLTVNVQATDSGSPAAVSIATFTINLTDANDAPILAPADLSVPENSAAGIVVGRIPGTDADTGDTLAFSIDKQTSNWFSIDQKSGELSVAAGASLDFESSSSSEVTVQVRDQAGLIAKRTYTVLIADANDPPRLVTPLPDTLATENALFQMTIPSSTFSDQDAGDSLTVSITTAEGFRLPAWLNFDAATRILSGTPRPSDAGSLSLKVTAVDTARAFASDTFVIAVGTPYPWHNAPRPLDANADGSTSPIDALFVINYLNRGAPPIVDPSSNPTQGYLDTNKDNFVSPIDALLIINFLNTQVSGGEGEFVVETDEIELAGRETQADFWASILVDEHRKRAEALLDVLAQDERFDA